MRRGHTCTASVLAVMLGLAVPPGRAEADETDPAAAQFFRAGLAAYERHEYRAAALAFEEADRRAPRAAAMYNAGRAWQAAFDAPRAADAFAAALAGADLAADDAARASKGLLALEPSLGKVAVTGPATAMLFFDETARGSLPRTVHAREGAHDVRVRRGDGSDVVRHVIVVVGQTESVAVEDALPVSELELVEIPPAARAGPASAKASPRSLRPWGYVAFGATAVLGVAGILTYLEFASERSAFNADNDRSALLDSTAAADHSAAEAYRAATYVLWGASAACGIAGVVLVAVPSSRDSRSTGLVLGPGTAFLRGSF